MARQSNAFLIVAPLMVSVVLFLSGASLFAAGAQTPQAQSADCSTFPIVTAESGVSFYSDRAGSVSDPHLVQQNVQALSNVRDFMACLERAVDGPGGAGAVVPAYRALGRWAAAGALMQTPPNTEGRVARALMSAGFGLIILKFRANGMPDDPVIDRWYAGLAAAVTDDYRDFRGNVYPWVGATNALSALISGDPNGRAFQDTAWRTELAQVQDDGTLAPELARSGRALVYHQLAASGLLVLHQARRALGIADDPRSMTRLKTLLQLVGTSLCDSGSLGRLAGAAQEKPGSWGFRVAYGFGGGLLPDGWTRCGPPKPDFNAVDYGGDTRKSAAAVAAAGHRSGR